MSTKRPADKENSSEETRPTRTKRNTSAKTTWVVENRKPVGSQPDNRHQHHLRHDPSYLSDRPAHSKVRTNLLSLSGRVLSQSCLIE